VKFLTNYVELLFAMPPHLCQVNSEHQWKFSQSNQWSTVCQQFICILFCLEERRRWFNFLRFPKV